VLIALAKTNCSDTLRDSLADILPTLLQGQMAMLLQLLMNGFPIRLRPLLHRFRPHRLVAKQLASSSSSLKPSGNGQPIPAVVARSRYSWTVPSPIPQQRAIWRCPRPNSKRNRRTSFVFRMDNLLAGTLISLFVESMPDIGVSP
jgi:hypothetical protein